MTPASQSEFAKALLDPDRPLPAGIASHTSATPAKRFAVYRNNVVVSLMNALRSRFPAVERIVGEEFFAACARVFAMRHPPRSKLLMTYGDGFPDFLAGFKPAAELPYVPDVARIEAARTRAYHAADASPLDPQKLAALAAEQLHAARLTLHPSVEVVRSRFPVVTIWAMNSGETELGPVDLDRPQDALIARPDDIVLVRALPTGGADFLLALHSGATLGEAAAEAAARSPEFDLTGNLAGLIGARVVTGYATAASERS